MSHSLCAGGQWGGCGRVFITVAAFDAHRVGNFAESGRGNSARKVKGARHCMTDKEMLAAGFIAPSSCVKAGQQVALWTREVSRHRVAAWKGKAAKPSASKRQSLHGESPTETEGAA